MLIEVENKNYLVLSKKDEEFDVWMKSLSNITKSSWLSYKYAACNDAGFYFVRLHLAMHTLRGLNYSFY